MPLKAKIASKAEIPAELVNHYAERDGAWFLDLDDGVDQSKFDELRDANTALRKEIADFKVKFEGIDPEEVRKLADEKRKLEESQQIKAGEIEKVVESRVKSARAEKEKQLAAMTAERDALNGRLATIQIDQAVVGEATKRGLRPTAILDITSRARSTFKLVNGVPQAFEVDGQTARYGRDGLSPMTLPEWVLLQVADAPHLFESNAGGGAAGNGGGTGGTARNPFRQETWNLTEQMKVQKTDPGLAARLKAAA